MLSHIVERWCVFSDFTTKNDVSNYLVQWPSEPGDEAFYIQVSIMSTIPFISGKILIFCNAIRFWLCNLVSESSRNIFEIRFYHEKQKGNLRRENTSYVHRFMKWLSIYWISLERCSFILRMNLWNQTKYSSSNVKLSSQRIFCDEFFSKFRNYFVGSSSDFELLALIAGYCQKCDFLLPFYLAKWIVSDDDGPVSICPKCKENGNFDNQQIAQFS